MSNCKIGDSMLSCLKGLPSRVKPQEHQRKLCSFMKKSHNKGILIFHGLGTGKTLSSIFLLKCLLKSQQEAIIFTPKSLITNYTKELSKVKTLDSSRITVNSYGVLLNQIENKTLSCRDKIVVIDEAHNLKARSGKRGRSMVEACTDKAKKVILLSATPIQNNVDEIVNLMAMITEYTPKEVKKMIYGNIGQFNHLFECNMSIYKSPENSVDFPSKRILIKRFQMTPEYYETYLNVQDNIKKGLPDIFLDTKNLAVFYNGIRRATNTLNYPSDKIFFTINKIMQSTSKNQKSLIYSNFKETGVNIIKEILKVNNIPYVEISGSNSVLQRTNAVKDYNKGRVKVMIITSAGGEGISLKETRNVIILEPTWNQEKLNQIIGRAVRYHSHSKLPPNERSVTVYILILDKPSKRMHNDYIESADAILYNMCVRKDMVIERFYKRLEPLSIENNRHCNV